MKKFLILIEDDFELLGNGRGNVADLQYLPALAFMNIVDQFGIKVSFMVDAAQQLYFAPKIATSRQIAIQYRLWEDTVVTALERGHDVQLHIHPQWLHAEEKDGHFKLDRNWNLGMYPRDEQEQLVEGCVGYLHELLRPIEPTYKVVGYKAGAWGMQPSKDLMEILQAHGVQVVMGARDGMFIPGNNVDFRNMEEPCLPYHPDTADLTKLARQPSSMIMIPMHGYSASLSALANLAFSRFNGLGKRKRRELDFYQRRPLPKPINGEAPLEGRHHLRFGLHPYATHLKIGDAPLRYLKTSFDSVFARLSVIEWPRIPIVIESHTKQFHGYYDDIERFLDYVLRRYDRHVEFGTVSAIAKELSNTPNLVRSHESCRATQAEC